MNWPYILRWTRRLLIVCALALLAYCGFALMDARIFEERADRQFDQLRAARGEPTHPVSLERTAS